MSDDWDFYPAQVDHCPASIFLDLGIAKEAPITALPDLAWLRLYMREPREDGLSSREEADRLFEVEDALNDAIAQAEQPIVFVGRNTSDGCRDFYYYTANGIQAEQLLSAALVPFVEYEFEVGTRQDAKWESYFEFLYPTSRDWQLIMNRRVIENLANSGDDHETVREICHWAYFTSAQGRDRYVVELSGKGFRIVAQRDDADGERPFSATVAHDLAIEFYAINDAVLELCELAERHDGNYDGWETKVCRPES